MACSPISFEYVAGDDTTDDSYKVLVRGVETYRFEVQVDRNGNKSLNEFNHFDELTMDHGVFPSLDAIAAKIADILDYEHIDREYQKDKRT